MVRLILGSSSPRRKEILSFFSLPFEQQSPDFDENSVPFQGDPAKYVCEISDGKAAALSHIYPEAVILTADTTVCFNGKLFQKPSSEQEAFEYLSELVGQWHSVFTGVTVCKSGKIFHQAEETRVLFNQLSPNEIRHYHSKIHWADKAGGYAAQSAGGLIVRKIDGCFYNVVGLPINTVRYLLKQIDIELWDYVQ